MLKEQFNKNLKNNLLIVGIVIALVIVCISSASNSLNKLSLDDYDINVTELFNNLNDY